MRILLFAILCLSTAACITAETDFVRGKRQEGDRVVANRTINEVSNCFRNTVYTLDIKGQNSFYQLVYKITFYLSTLKKKTF